MRHLIQKFQHHYAVILVSLFITLVFVTQTRTTYHWPFIEQLEYLLYDTRVLLTMPGDVDPRIVIVDIDEKSLAELGQWPWGRDRLAKLINELFDYYQVQIVGFDVTFPEPDESSGLRVLDQLAKTDLADNPDYRNRLNDLRPQLDYDRVFADSLQDRPVVIGYYFNLSGTGQRSGTKGMLPQPALTKDDFKTTRVYAQRAVGYNANIDVIQNSAMDGGHFTPALDEDGVVRRVPLLVEYQGNYYQSIALAIAKYILFAADLTPVFGEELFEDTGYPRLEWLQLGFNRIPVDANVQALVPYRGRNNSFPYVSAVDVIRGLADPEILAGAIVLVGTTTETLFDMRTTPVQKDYPGVEIHANMIAGILDNAVKEKPTYTRGVEFLQILITGLLLAVILPLLSPVLAVSLILFTFVATIGFNFFYWHYYDLVFHLASVLILILLIFLVNIFYGFFIERRGKLQLSGLFGQYVPPELVDEMSENPLAYTQEAQSREMTVLFTDVRGFTTISEGLSPGDLSDLMNAYLTPMTRIIHENRGTIDKYIGDAIMAFWNAPMNDPNHARNAVVTGLAMLERTVAIREEFLERGWPEIRIGVGINTGIMSVGDMGSEFRMAYTVLGDAVNLGSRLEGLTKGYGVEIIVSESTRDAVSDFVYRELDVVRVKGKDEPIAIYEPLAPLTEVSDEEFKELAIHEQAMKAYYQQHWEPAQNYFRQAQALAPGRKLYQVYQDRIAEFKNNPPGADWDGVFTYTTK
jgi:adenylate cyclase